MLLTERDTGKLIIRLCDSALLMKGLAPFVGPVPAMPS
jgi:hypothetical protein